MRLNEKIKKKILYELRKRNIYLKKIPTKYYYTWWLRPNDARNIESDAESEIDESFGIILTGQLCNLNSFTFETIKLYKQYYPKAKIILSSWTDESSEEIDKIRRIGGVYVCLSEQENVINGTDNTNKQIHTGRVGIKMAEFLGCKYVARTRCDQRVFAPLGFDYCLKMIHMFPLKIRCKAKSRLLISNLNTFGNWLYRCSDLFIVGNIEDVKRYYQCPMYVRKEIEPQYDQWDISHVVETSKELSRGGCIRFTSEYIKSCGFELKWTLEDSDFYRNELFVIIDNENIDLFWNKYTDSEYRYRSYNKNALLKQVDFKDWLLAQR